MEFSHISVLLDECIEGLMIKPNGVYVDGTLGGAGHSSEILKRLDEGGILVGIDQDQNAIKVSTERLEKVGSKGQIIIRNTNFCNIDKVLEEAGIDSVDGILMDLGVSSHQLDEGSRGFSYNQDARLDMRMNSQDDISAFEVVNTYSEEALRTIIEDYGEERWAARIANFIVDMRKKKSIETTWELVEVIKAAVPKGARKDGPHPAKRTFQAIRIEVNKELEVLENVLDKAFKVLKQGGRLLIITFHSLEDRIVKRYFANLAKKCTCPVEFPICKCGGKPKGLLVARKGIDASTEELDRNPRSRSAKLRIVEKL